MTYGRPYRRPAPTCQRCGKAVRWTITRATGASMALDATPNPAGNVVELPGGIAEVYATAEAAAGRGTRWMPHAATCKPRPPRRPPRRRLDDELEELARTIPVTTELDRLAAALEAAEAPQPAQEPAR